MHARSGDKGNRGNIGVVANDAACYDWLRQYLTAAVVADYLRPLGAGAVRRVRAAQNSCAEFRDRDGTGGGGEPFAPVRHPGQGAGRGALGAERARSPGAREAFMSNSPAFVTRSDGGPVLILTLNRPERRTLGGELIEELSEALAHAEVDAGVRAVVITGADGLLPGWT